MDATRIADGQPVCLKTIVASSDESRIALSFSDGAIKDDPHNHCAPVLDLFPDEHDPNTSILVMPRLREFDEPPFEYVQDVVDVVDQLLEVRRIARSGLCGY